MKDNVEQVSPIAQQYPAKSTKTVKRIMREIVRNLTASRIYGKN